MLYLRQCLFICYRAQAGSSSGCQATYQECLLWAGSRNTKKISPGEISTKGGALQPFLQRNGKENPQENSADIVMQQWKKGRSFHNVLDIWTQTWVLKGDFAWREIHKRISSVWLPATILAQQEQGRSRGVWGWGVSQMTETPTRPGDWGGISCDGASELWGTGAVGQLGAGLTRAGTASAFHITLNQQATPQSTTCPLHITCTWQQNAWELAAYTLFAFFSCKEESKQSLWIFWLPQGFQSCEEIEISPLVFTHCLFNRHKLHQAPTLNLPTLIFHHLHSNCTRSWV